ncbi:MAG: hypothetical protein RL338_17 [Chloroflexota bacterium]
MSGAASRPDDGSAAIARLVADAEPRASRPAGELIARLADAGLLRGAFGADGTAADPASLADLPLAGVGEDSRTIRAGGCIAAIAGEHADGHDHLAGAAARGASLALVTRPVSGAGLPALVVADGRRALAVAACWWYGDPSRSLGTVGITGTDGKTTTSFLAVAALEAAGIRSGLVGTVATRIGGREGANPEHVTTPGAPALQAALRAMVASGDDAAVVETTSHGLALHRVDGIAYDIAIFTNLSHEHLELHGTFEAYRAAKLSLFERLRPAAEPKVAGRWTWPSAAIVNADDPNAAYFVAAAREAGARVITYGLGGDAEVRATAIAEDARRLSFDATTPTWRGRVSLRLAGRFNVMNALAIVALGHVLELDPAAVASGLAGLDGVPGRMERVDAGQPFGVIVDYAHSPASLGSVLDLLSPVAAAGGGGVIAVFGSAGERDRAKRPLMGRIAGERCRLVVVTDEDPRGEAPEAIVDEIVDGAIAAGRTRGVDVLGIPDRRAAIAAAFERARPGDIVLLAGKGHERSIIRAAGPEPWDERAEALAALARLGHRGGGA